MGNEFFVALGESVGGIVVVDTDGDIVRFLDEFLTSGSEFKDAELFDFLRDEFFEEGLPYDGFPEKGIVVGTLAPLFELILMIDLSIAVFMAHHDIDDIFGFESLLGGKDSFEGILHLFFGGDARLGMETIVAAAAVLGVEIFAKIAHDIESAASGRLGIRNDLLDELVGHFLLGDIFVGEELIKFFDIVFGVESDALAFTAIAAGTACFLVVASRLLGIS